MKDGDREDRKFLMGHDIGDCAEFCERWDQSSFGLDHDDLPPEFFRPMVERFLARKAHAPQAPREGARGVLTDAAVAAQRAAGKQILGGT